MKISILQSPQPKPFPDVSELGFGRHDTRFAPFCGLHDHHDFHRIPPAALRRQFGLFVNATNERWPDRHVARKYWLGLWLWAWGPGLRP